MSTATNHVLDLAQLKNLDLRTAAYVLALNKLNDFYLTRGIDIWTMIITEFIYVLSAVTLFFLWRKEVL